MNDIKWYKFYNAMKGFYYLVFIITMIYGCVWFYTNDFEKISDNMVEVVDISFKGASCTIEYGKFKYEGICSDRQSILDYINDTVIKNE